MEDGFIPLGRSFFSHPFWSERRVFSRAEAWVDLVQEAEWKARKKMLIGKMIEVPRGGIVASVRFLSDRWTWSNTKVCQFLEILRQDSMITTEKRQGITIVILCNYDKFNPVDKEGKTTRKRRGNDGETTVERRRDDETEEGKEVEQTNTQSPRGLVEGVVEAGEMSKQEVWRWACDLLGHPGVHQSRIEQDALYESKGITRDACALVTRYHALCRREPQRYTKPRATPATLIAEFHAEVGKARQALGPEKKPRAPVATQPEQTPSSEPTEAGRRALAATKAAISGGPREGF